MANGKKPWFPVKRYGYGAGLPISWEGWVLVALYIAVVTGAGAVLPPLYSILVIVVATALMLYIARARSDAEWRWRDGSE